jgi:putative ABC transport system permease protein
VLDRLVLTDIETVRYIHEEQAKIEVAEKGSTDEETVNLPDAATAVVLSYRTPAAAAFLPRKIDASETFTAGSPTFEIARLVRYARPLVTAVEAVGFLLALVAGGGAAVAMVAAMNARARDLALLRALGARPYTLALVALAEAAILAVAALALGAVLSLAAVFAIRGWLADNTGLLLEPKIDAAQIGGLIAGVAAVALVATAVPAWRAARASIEDLLTS